MPPAAASAAHAESSRRSSHPYSRQTASPAPTTLNDIDDVDGADDMDESLKAKVARKEARIIRNRESAQRSRNQRKAHLVWLEERVKELEQENASLRGSSPSSSSSTLSPSKASHPKAISERSASPALSVSSTATLLPYTGGGVNLASVAPPPPGLAMDVDVKPALPVEVDLDAMTRLAGENNALRDRVAKLEELVKHLTPLISLSLPPTSASSDITSGHTATVPSAPTETDTASTDIGSENAFDISAWVNPTTHTTTQLQSQPDGLSTTLSPPLHPSLSLDTNSPTRHPAAMTTSPSLIGSREALQRVGGKLDLGTALGRGRMEMAARVIVALATRRAGRLPEGKDPGKERCRSGIRRTRARARRALGGWRRM